MQKIEAPAMRPAEFSDEAIRGQLEAITRDPAFRSSKRSIQFLNYIVEQTLAGGADHIKERSIGVDVFGREPSYDTATDHVVRTAAIELRKRLAIYYGSEHHRSELRLGITPGSYIPHFSLPSAASDHDNDLSGGAFSVPIPLHQEPVKAAAEIAPRTTRRGIGVVAGALAGAALTLLIVFLLRSPHSKNDALDLFWQPVIDTPGSVLLAVGDVPNGPPSPSPNDLAESIPVIQKALAANVPFSDAVTIARVLSAIQSRGKKVVIRQETSSSFSDLREGPVVLIGAFNNEWSLRLTHQLRFSLALDADRHLIYIRDAKNPDDRTWSQVTSQTVDQQLARGGPTHQDFALVSRIWNSETGHVVVVIGGLYVYGTEAAGEFVTDPQLLQAITKAAPLDNAHSNLQIVLGTTVTDGSPGRPRILAVASE